MNICDFLGNIYSIPGIILSPPVITHKMSLMGNSITLAYPDEAVGHFVDSDPCERPRPPGGLGYSFKQPCYDRSIYVIGISNNYIARSWSPADFPWLATKPKKIPTYVLACRYGLLSWGGSQWETCHGKHYTVALRMWYDLWANRSWPGCICINVLLYWNNCCFIHTSRPVFACGLTYFSPCSWRQVLGMLPRPPGITGWP